MRIARRLAAEVLRADWRCGARHSAARQVNEPKRPFDGVVRRPERPAIETPQFDALPTCMSTGFRAPTIECRSFSESSRTCVEVAKIHKTHGATLLQRWQRIRKEDPVHLTRAESSRIGRSVRARSSEKRMWALQRGSNW